MKITQIELDVIKRQHPTATLKNTFLHFWGGNVHNGKFKGVLIFAILGKGTFRIDNRN